MSIEICKVVRQILAPAAIVVPCMMLLAATPALAGPQSTGQSDSSSNSSSDQQSQSDSAQSNPTETVTTLNQVVVVAPEEAVATVETTAFTHISPALTVISVLNNIPGVNAQALGPLGFIPSDTAFTVDGFASNEIGTTFDGVPFINTFLGGLYGEGDDQSATPIDPIFVSGMKLYSGANTTRRRTVFPRCCWATTMITTTRRTWRDSTRNRIPRLSTCR
jgi:hypothetical protein